VHAERSSCCLPARAFFRFRTSSRPCSRVDSSPSRCAAAESTEGAQVRAEEAGTAAPAHHGAVRDGWHRPLLARVGQAAQRLTGRPGRRSGRPSRLLFGVSSTIPMALPHACFRLCAPATATNPSPSWLTRDLVRSADSWPRPVFPPAQWLAALKAGEPFAVDPSDYGITSNK